MFLRSQWIVAGMQMPIFLALLIVPAMAGAGAQDIIKLNMSDIAFQWRAPPEGAFICGYAVQGNRHSWKSPRTEWDINIDEIVRGDNRVVGVSAGSFVVTGKTRTPRSPIIELVFTTENDVEPFPAQLVGAPNSDNGVRGKIDLERAPKLFKALSTGRRIDVTLKYADGSSDHLQFSGFRDKREFDRSKNGLFDECLRGRTPTPGGGWDVRVGAH
jgi:hypothetical protein